MNKEEEHDSIDDLIGGIDNIANDISETAEAKTKSLSSISETDFDKFTLIYSFLYVILRRDIGTVSYMGNFLWKASRWIVNNFCHDNVFLCINGDSIDIGCL